MELSIDRLNEHADAVDTIIWLRNVAKVIGPGFHPDTPGDDYIVVASGLRLFTDAEAESLDSDLTRSFEILAATGRDPYTVAGKVQRRLIGMPRP